MTAQNSRGVSKQSFESDGDLLEYQESAHTEGGTAN